LTLATLFWLMVFLICYTYFFYPAIILLLVTLKRSAAHSIEPSTVASVTGIIAVYNEESVLPEKLRNISTVQYPKDYLTFLFGSDGSADATTEIIASSKLENVALRAFSQRRGKVSVLNDLVREARGEIIMFSDANTLFRPDTVQKLVNHFSDSRVGAVSGKLLLQSDKATAGGRGETSYWEYENHLKNLESKLLTILGATGGVYAIRKSLYVPLPTSGAISDDFLIPMQIVKQGYRVVYEPEAIAIEKLSNSVVGEFKRKVRIGAQNYQTIPYFAELLHPRQGFVAFALWSHKIIRWCVPFLLIALAGISLILGEHNQYYRWMCIGEFLFVLIALGGLIAERLNLRIGIFSLPYYFLAMNAALFVGFVKFLFGRQQPTWDTGR
jgi:poly-beta-1,6-N-acetyl-D-glucosamine synthase